MDSASEDHTTVGDGVTVEVVAALSGAVVCRVEARTVPELKVAIEEASGIHRFDQQLTLDSKALEDGCQLSDFAAWGAMVVQLLQAATVAGATRRALRRVSIGDAKMAVEAFEEELAGTPAQGIQAFTEAFHAILQLALSRPDTSEGCADVTHSLLRHHEQAVDEREGDEWPPISRFEFTLVVARVFTEQLRSLPFNMGFVDPGVREWTAPEMLALTSFIGRLATRGRLPWIMYVRIGNAFINYSVYPEERYIECICELLAQSLDLDEANLRARGFPAKWTRKLSMLKDMMDPVSGMPLYSERLRARMQSIVDLVGSDPHVG